MGSFNLICSVSGQIIAPEALCAVVPLVQAAEMYPALVQTPFDDLAQEVLVRASSICHPDAYWEILGISVLGVYEDRGRVNLEASNDNRRGLLSLVRFLLSHGVVTLPGENPIHEKAFDLTQFIIDDCPELFKLVSAKAQIEDIDKDILDAELNECWNYIQAGERSNRIFVQYLSSSIRSLKFAHAHECAMQELVAIAAQCTGIEKSYSQESLFKTGISRFNEERQVELNSLNMLTLEEPPELAQKLIKARLHLLSGYLLENILRDSKRFFSREATKPFNSALHNWMVGLDSDKQLFDNLKPILNFAYAMQGLRILGRSIAPSLYGGQDHDNEAGVLLANFVDRIETLVTDSLT